MQSRLRVLLDRIDEIRASSVMLAPVDALSEAICRLQGERMTSGLHVLDDTVVVFESADAHYAGVVGVEIIRLREPDLI